MGKINNWTQKKQKLELTDKQHAVHYNLNERL